MTHQTPAHHAQPALDRLVLRARLATDEGVYGPALEEAIDSVPARFADLIAAVFAEDGHALRASARSWRSLASRVGARRAAEVLGDLERCAERDAVGDAEPLVRALTEALENVIPMLANERARLAVLAVD